MTFVPSNLRSSAFTSKSESGSSSPSFVLELDHVRQLTPSKFLSVRFLSRTLADGL